MKKKALSFDEKRERLLNIFHEKVPSYLHPLSYPNRKKSLTSKNLKNLVQRLASVFISTSPRSSLT